YPTALARGSYPAEAGAIPCWCNRRRKPPSRGRPSPPPGLYCCSRHRLLLDVPSAARARRIQPASRRDQRSSYENVPELPRVGLINVFRKQSRPPVKRRPVGIITVHRAKIGHLDFEAALEIHLVGFDNAGFGIFQRPYHAGEHRRRYLK